MNIYMLMKTGKKEIKKEAVRTASFYFFLFAM